MDNIRYRKTMADAYAEVAEHKGTEPHEHPHEPTDPDVPDSGTDSEWEEVDLVEEVSAKEFDALKKCTTLKIKYNLVCQVVKILLLLRVEVGVKNIM